MAKIPSTPALRVLRAARIDFAIHRYDYVERGGTRASAVALGVEEHAVIKTLVMHSDARHPLIVLMHGDAEVSTRQLARSLSVKSITPCTRRDVQRLTGYRPGGVSPLGTRRTLPICVEESILALPRIWINGGKRGLLVSLDPAVLAELLPLTSVRVARMR